jgi:hypothetical protein
MDTVTRRWIDFAGKGRLASDPSVGRDTFDRHAPAPEVVSAAIPADANLADIYVELDLAAGGRDATRMLQRAAGLLDAVGLVVWAWDAKESELVPALAHGYSDQVLAQLPTVRSDADNATAAAFRSAQTCIVKSNGTANGAVVVPLMTPAGCVGVFAVELPRGAEQREPVRALTTSLAAQFADLVGAPRLSHAVSA